MRPLSALATAVLSGATVTTRWIARAVLPSGTYCGSDGPDDLTWDNGAGPLTYRGFDQAFSLTLPPSQGARQKTGATLNLSGTDPAVMASLFAEDYRGAPADLAMLLIDPATGLPAEELLMARGALDVGMLTDSPAKPTDPKTPQVSTLSLTITPQTVDLDRPGVRQGTDVDQRLYRDENDGFFKDVALAGTSQINWGIAGTSAPKAVTPAVSTRITIPSYLIGQL